PESLGRCGGPSNAPMTGSYTFSVLEQELRMVQQGPEQVFGGPPAVAGLGGEGGDGQLALRRGGIAGERGKEELVHDRGIIRARFQELADAVIRSDDLGVEGAAADDLQRLLESGIRPALALAGV